MLVFSGSDLLKRYRAKTVSTYVRLLPPKLCGGSRALRGPRGWSAPPGSCGSLDVRAGSRGVPHIEGLVLSHPQGGAVAHRPISQFSCLRSCHLTFSSELFYFLQIKPGSAGVGPAVALPGSTVCVLPRPWLVSPDVCCRCGVPEAAATEPDRMRLGGSLCRDGLGGSRVSSAAWPLGRWRVLAVRS